MNIWNIITFLLVPINVAIGVYQMNNEDLPLNFIAAAIILVLGIISMPK